MAQTHATTIQNTPVALAIFLPTILHGQSDEQHILQ